MKASITFVRITPKKLNLIAEMVREKSADEALNMLKFTPKKGADIIYKLLESALANAENNFKQDKSALYIKEIVVTKGPTFKRSVPISRGRVHPILKRNSQINLTLGVKEATDKKTSKKEATVEKAEDVETVKKAPKAKTTAKKTTAKKSTTSSTKVTA